MASFSTFFHGRMAGLEITCLQSFLDYGHDLCIYAYDDCGVPAHFQVLDAGDIAPADRLFFYKAGFGAGSPAGFTNYFRYTLPERSDTIWIDADVLCLSRDWPAQTAVLAAWEDADHINGAVLGLPRQAAFLPGGGGEIRQGHRLGQAGPFLLTRVLAELGLTSSVFPPGVFYPIHYSEWYKPFMPEYTGEVNARSKASLAIHLWHSLVRYTNFDKTLLPDEDSFFGQAVLRHATAAYFKRRDRSEYLAHVTACRDMGLPG